jgi:hypothetical protein
MFKCNLSMLRLTSMLSLFALPIALTRLLCFQQRTRPPFSFAMPTTDGVCTSHFPNCMVLWVLILHRHPKFVFRCSDDGGGNGRKSLDGCTGTLYPVTLRWYENSRMSRTTARSHQLHIPPNEYHMGLLRIRHESTNVSPIQAWFARRDIPRETT